MQDHPRSKVEITSPEEESDASLLRRFPFYEEGRVPQYHKYHSKVSYLDELELIWGKRWGAQGIDGMAQGLGEALLERLVYDANGQMLTASFMDYALPRASDIPEVELAHIETPSPFNLLGAKGVGEAGCIGVPVAIVNATLDALAPYGVASLDMPLTSEKIWRALNGMDTSNREGSL
jgi:hypothetical protein